ncbi:MAG TPA: zinc ribbon domain-containing protein [Pyrinomonadaceae bacterium]|nr:zinc ribbon domain-containing protein [Pyrinomonadaceae bacterium]
MFCPKCATQNVDGASFCRSCGANVSLIPQALSGQMQAPVADDLDEGSSRHRKRGRREATLDNAFRNAFMGIAFLLVAIALSFSAMGRGWWFWMLIPAFSMMGTGVAQYIRFKERQKDALPPAGFGVNAVQQPPRANTFPARQTGELMPAPPSVTEGTTRHLGAEAPTRHFGTPDETSK